MDGGPAGRPQPFGDLSLRRWALRLAASLSMAAALLVTGSAAEAGSGFVTHYRGDHYIVSARTADKYLHGASSSFHRYAARKGAALLRTTVSDGMASTCPGYSGVQVRYYHSRGFASGFMSSDCDGGMTVWKKAATGWRVVQSTQESWRCSILTHNAVPASVLGGRPTCWSDAQQQLVAYHHR